MTTNDHGSACIAVGARTASLRSSRTVASSTTSGRKARTACRFAIASNTVINLPASGMLEAICNPGASVRMGRPSAMARIGYASPRMERNPCAKRLWRRPRARRRRLPPGFGPQMADCRLRRDSDTPVHDQRMPYAHEIDSDSGHQRPE